MAVHAVHPLEQELEGLGKFSLMHPGLATWVMCGQARNVEDLLSPLPALVLTLSLWSSVQFAFARFFMRESGGARDIHSAGTTVS